MARHAASTRRCIRWTGVPLFVSVAILATACGSGSSTTGGPATPATVAGTTVNLRATDTLQTSVVVAVGLWKELRAAGVSSTITGFDQSGRFSLTTSDPARVRQVVAERKARSVGTAAPASGCAPASEPAIEESATPPDAQPGPGTERLTKVFQTTGPIAAGTGGEDAFGGGSIREVSVKVDDRPPTAVVSTNQTDLKKAGADFGPGLIVVDGMFVDPVRESLPPRTDRSATGAC